ncbi:hypothetical protein AVEN_162758-1, partial [Araneus ventricosus]
MIQKFEETRSLAVRSVKGQKPVSEQSVTDVTAAIVDATYRTIAGSSSSATIEFKSFD